MKQKKYNFKCVSNSLRDSVAIELFQQIQLPLKNKKRIINKKRNIKIENQ